MLRPTDPNKGINSYSWANGSAPELLNSQMCLAVVSICNRFLYLNVFIEIDGKIKKETTQEITKQACEQTSV